MREFFTVKHNERYDKLNLTLTATSGTCQIKPSEKKDVVSIYGSEDQKNYKPDLRTELVGRVKKVDFVVKDQELSGMGKVLSGRMFGSDPCKKNNWQIQLSDSKPLNLNLHYAVGEAEADLSGLPVENLNIHTGNANVKIDYSKKKFNPIEMDTFHVKVDMGTLQVNQLNYSKAKEIIAEVGLGKISLDFTSPHITCHSNISAKVGAGSMEIHLAENQNPILIKVNNSPLCHIKIPKSFKKIDNNTYVNHLYKPNADHLLTFDLDITVGHISFISK